jgi:uncharacterized protein YegL
MKNANGKKGNGGRMAGRNPELAELVFVLDRSGSMSGMERAVIDGFNELLEKQKRAPGRALVSVELFDDRFDVVYDRAELGRVRPLTEREYFTRGCTALLDAVGRTIAKTDNARRHTAESERAEKVVMVITTDGMENASREYSYSKIKKMIERKKEEGWEFLFLGANIDAVETADDLGIRRDRAANYRQTNRGVERSYYAMSEAISSVRMGCAEKMDLAEYLKEDEEND